MSESVTRAKDGSVKIVSQLGPTLARQGFEKRLLLAKEAGIEIADGQKWERAHSQGPITGHESEHGIVYAPFDVNRKYMQHGIEDQLREFENAKAPGVEFELETVTECHPMTRRLSRIQYKLTGIRNGSRTMVFEVAIEVPNTLKDPQVSVKARRGVDVDLFLNLAVRRPPTPEERRGAEKSSIDLAKGRARLRRSSGGFADLGLKSGKGVSKMRAAAGVMLAQMVIAGAARFALECENWIDAKNDLEEFERWILRQQMNSPSTGYLLAVQYSIYTMGPVAEPLVKYVHTAYYAANTLEKVAELMRKDPPDNMLARTGVYQPAQYTYPEPMLHWYPPLVPVGVDAPNQRLGAVLAAMEPPSDDREAFHILDGASMSELLVMYSVLFRSPGCSPLWRSIDGVSVPIDNKGRDRLHVAVKAVRAKQDRLSFGNFCATAGIPIPDKGTPDYNALAKYFGVGGEAKTVPEWLQGWWTVYDSSYYYYYFSESPKVVFTRAKPAGGGAPAPTNPANRGSVALTENGCKITWNPNGPGGPTIETFWQLHAKGNEMNGTSNKYGGLFARKLQ